MSFAPEGRIFIGWSLALAAGMWALLVLGVGSERLWIPVLTGVATVLAGFMLYFFRDPTPRVPEDPLAVVAPGQGRVVAVDEVDEPSFLEGPARRISIFLSLFDVHVQRAPVTGTVEHFSRRSGGFMAAWSSRASDANEQASLGLETPRGRVLVRQIVGLVARRIVTDPRKGDEVERGDRIGMIRFGSRVDLFVPRDWPVTCRVGQKAVVGATVLARFPEVETPGRDVRGASAEREAS